MRPYGGGITKMPKKIKPYRISKSIKYELPIPCLLWVPFWLLGIVIGRYEPFIFSLVSCHFSLVSVEVDSIADSINASLRISILVCSIILFFIPKCRVISIALISLIAGYLVYTSSQSFTQNHISNLFARNEISELRDEIGDRSLEFGEKENGKWQVSRYGSDNHRLPHLQQFVRGRIVSDKQYVTNGYRYTLDLLSFSDIPIKGKISFFTSNDSLLYGDIIQTTIRMRENRVSNPGEVDFYAIQRQAGIYASGFAVSPILVERKVRQETSDLRQETSPPTNINVLQTAEGNSASYSASSISLEPPYEGGQSERTSAFPTEKHPPNPTCEGGQSERTSALVNESIIEKIEFGIYRLRGIIRKKYQDNLDYSIPMALSLMIGERQFLSDYAENFASETLPSSGLMHFFAVSGLHVGILALFIMFTLKLFRVPRNFIQITTITILILYAFICNLAPPVVRAVIFFSIFILAELTCRLVNKWQVFLFSLFIVTLVNPTLLFSVSLQFSYLAFAGIIIGNQIYQKVEKAYHKSLPIPPCEGGQSERTSAFPTNMRKSEISATGTDSINASLRKAVSYLLNYILMIGCIQMLIMPVQIYSFQNFNLNTFFGNLLGAVFVSILLPLFLVILVLPAAIPLYSFLTTSAEFLTDMFNRYIVFLSRFPFVIESIQDYKRLIFLFILIAFGLLLIAYAQNKKRLFQGAFLCLVSLVLFIPINERKDFQVIFFDTGNSDCFLLRFSEKDYMLIDTGDSDKNSKNITRNLIPYLKKEKVKNISKVILTHEHLDHYGGIFYLGEKVRIDTLMISEKFFNSEIGHQIRQSEDFQNTFFFVISDTLTYKNKDYSIKFLHPDKDYQHRNENNHSVVCRIDYKDISLLFVGDLEREAEQHIARNYPEYLKADILKAGHHGSNTSSHEEFLNLVRPELIIFSASGEVGRNFPNPIVIERAGQVANQVFTTGRGGAVILR